MTLYQYCIARAYNQLRQAARRRMLTAEEQESRQVLFVCVERYKREARHQQAADTSHGKFRGKWVK